MHGINNLHWREFISVWRYQVFVTFNLVLFIRVRYFLKDWLFFCKTLGLLFLFWELFCFFFKARPIKLNFWQLVAVDIEEVVLVGGSGYGEQQVDWDVACESGQPGEFGGAGYLRQFVVWTASCNGAGQPDFPSNIRCLQEQVWGLSAKLHAQVGCHTNYPCLQQQVLWSTRSLFECINPIKFGDSRCE